jgi:hypothetical protein
VLKSYFDGSGSLKPPAKRPSITLSGYVANDDAWAMFELDWLRVLASNSPAPKYLHMQEAMALRGEFAKKKGWTRNDVKNLVHRLLSAVYEGSYRNNIYGVSCTIYMDDYDRAVSEGFKLSDPHRICSHICAGTASNQQAIVQENLPVNQLVKIESIDFFFDKNEKFLRHFYSAWMEKRKTKDAEDYLAWQLINCVAPIEMRKNPPLQFADMYAWARNRCAGFGDHVNLCRTIIGATDASEWNLDYEILTKKRRSIIPYSKAVI